MLAITLSPMPSDLGWSGRFESYNSIKLFFAGLRDPSLTFSSECLATSVDNFVPGAYKHEYTVAK